MCKPSILKCLYRMWSFGLQKSMHPDWVPCCRVEREVCLDWRNSFDGHCLQSLGMQGGKLEFPRQTCL